MECMRYRQQKRHLSIMSYTVENCHHEVKGCIEAQRVSVEVVFHALRRSGERDTEDYILKRRKSCFEQGV